MKRQYHKWWSPRLQRDMELLIFGHAGSRVLVFPTRCGRFFDYEDFGLLESVRSRIESGQLQLYCLDSIDHETFYCRDASGAQRVRRHQRYEEYVLEEVLPLSELLNGDTPLIAHGCSLGAYHALNITLRHPRRFGRAVALSGRYDLTRPVDHFDDLLAGHWDDLVYFHMPNVYLPNVQEAKLLATLRSLQIVLAVGEADPFRADNHRMADTLRQLGVPHAFHLWSGRAHCPNAWHRMIELYL